MPHDDGDPGGGNDGDSRREPPSVYDILVGEVVDDEVFRAVADAERRFALYYLVEHRRATVDELADVVTGWSHAARGESTGPADRNEVATALVHSHLPLLREARLITHDPGGDGDAVVQLAPLSDPVRRLLRWAYEREGIGSGGHDDRRGAGE